MQKIYFWNTSWWLHQFPIYIRYVVLSWIFGKRNSGYSGQSNKYPIPRDRWPIYSTKHFCTEIRSLEKTFMLKTLLKNLLHSNCDLWSLQNQHSRKHQNLSYLSHKEKALQWCSWKYFFTWGRHIPKTSIAKTFLKECPSQTVILNLSKTTVLENNRIWVISALTKKAFHHCSWKYPFRSFLCDLWYLVVTAKKYECFEA